MIRLESVSYRVGDQFILNDINLNLVKGELLSIIGPSGAGKTSVLRLIAGLEMPTQGQIFFDKQPMNLPGRGLLTTPQERGVGYVFQEPALWPHMSVREHLEWPLSVKRVSAKTRQRRAFELLTAVKLHSSSDKYPSMLSGGEKQRLALARALIYRPKVLLLDEPFANLDAHMKLELRDVLRTLHAEFDTTSILVTHDQLEAAALADRIAIVADGQLVQCGSVDELARQPASIATARLFGSPAGMILPAHKEGDEYISLGQPVAMDLPTNFVEPLEIHYASETIKSRPSRSRSERTMTVLEKTPYGGRWQCRATVSGHQFTYFSDEAPALNNDQYELCLPDKPATVFWQGQRLKTKKIVLVRHGMSKWNKEGRLQGQADSELAPEAEDQLRELSLTLDLQQYTNIEVSPLKRAYQSADLLMLKGYQTRNEWKEIDVGQWQGELIANLDRSQYLAWRIGEYTPPQAEPWLQFCDRIHAQIQRLTALEGNSLVICHGGVMRAALTVMGNLTSEQLAQPQYSRSGHASRCTIWIEPTFSLEL